MRIITRKTLSHYQIRGKFSGMRKYNAEFGNNMSIFPLQPTRFVGLLSDTPPPEDDQMPMDSEHLPDSVSNPGFSGNVSQQLSLSEDSPSPQHASDNAESSIQLLNESQIKREVLTPPPETGMDFFDFPYSPYSIPEEFTITDDQFDFPLSPPCVPLTPTETESNVPLEQDNISVPISLLLGPEQTADTSTSLLTLHYPMTSNVQEGQNGICDIVSLENSADTMQPPSFNEVFEEISQDAIIQPDTTPDPPIQQGLAGNAFRTLPRLIPSSSLTSPGSTFNNYQQKTLPPVPKLIPAPRKVPVNRDLHLSPYISPNQAEHRSHEIGLPAAQKEIDTFAALIHYGMQFQNGKLSRNTSQRGDGQGRKRRAVKVRNSRSVNVPRVLETIRQDSPPTSYQVRSAGYAGLNPGASNTTSNPYMNSFPVHHGIVNSTVIPNAHINSGLSLMSAIPQPGTSNNTGQSWEPTSNQTLAEPTRNYFAMTPKCPPCYNNCINSTYATNPNINGVQAWRRDYGSWNYGYPNETAQFF